MASKKQSSRPTREQAETIEMVFPLVTAVVGEMRELSKKKQDGILSTLKVRSINRLLGDVEKALGDDPSLRYLDLLDEDDLPQNSDAVLVLAQWEAALKQFKAKHFGWDGSDHVWFLKSGRTYDPDAGG